MLGDNAAVSLTVKPPYALINALLVKDLSGVDGQEFHDFKFLAGQRDRFTAAGNTPLRIINGQLPENFALVLWRERSSRRRWAATLAPSTSRLNGLTI